MRGGLKEAVKSHLQRSSKLGQTRPWATWYSSEVSPVFSGDLVLPEVPLNPRCCISCRWCLKVLVGLIPSQSKLHTKAGSLFFFADLCFLKWLMSIWSLLLSLKEGKLAGSALQGLRGLKKWNINSRILSGLAQCAIRCEVWIEICGVWCLAQTELEFNHLKACPARHSHCVESWNMNILCAFNKSHKSVWFYRSLHSFLALAYDK